MEYGDKYMNELKIIIENDNLNEYQEFYYSGSDSYPTLDHTFMIFGHMGLLSTCPPLMYGVMKNEFNIVQPMQIISWIYDIGGISELIDILHYQIDHSWAMINVLDNLHFKDKIKQEQLDDLFYDACKKNRDVVAKTMYHFGADIHAHDDRAIKVVESDGLECWLRHLDKEYYDEHFKIAGPPPIDDKSNEASDVTEKDDDSDFDEMWGD